MRIMNWNIEWMNNWYVGGSKVEFNHECDSTMENDRERMPSDHRPVYVDLHLGISE